MTEEEHTCSRPLANLMTCIIKPKQDIVALKKTQEKLVAPLSLSAWHLACLAHLCLSIWAVGSGIWLGT